MKLPIWLYEKRGEKLRTRRFGSRRPLRICLTIFDEPDHKYGMPPCYMFCLGKFGIQFGPEDGVSEGFTSMPPGSGCKLVSLWRGFGLGLTWDGPSQPKTYTEKEGAE